MQTLYIYLLMLHLQMLLPGAAPCHGFALLRTHQIPNVLDLGPSNSRLLSTSQTVSTYLEILLLGLTPCQAWPCCVHYWVHQRLVRGQGWQALQIPAVVQLAHTGAVYHPPKHTGDMHQVSSSVLLHRLSKGSRSCGVASKMNWCKGCQALQACSRQQVTRVPNTLSSSMGCSSNHTCTPHVPTAAVSPSDRRDGSQKDIAAAARYQASQGLKFWGGKINLEKKGGGDTRSASSPAPKGPAGAGTLCPKAPNPA